MSRPAGQAFGKKVRDRAASLGRDPSGIRIIPGLVVILGETREEALRKHELYSGAGSEDGLLARFARENGIDPRDFDPDAKLDAERFIPDQNRQWAVGMGLGLSDLLTHEKLTAREAVRRSEGHHRLLLGTPEDVADGIIDLWQDGTVDGYTLQPPRQTILLNLSKRSCQCCRIAVFTRANTKARQYATAMACPIPTE